LELIQLVEIISDFRPHQWAKHPVQQEHNLYYETTLG
jgi:hypothetical protein